MVFSPSLSGTPTQSNEGAPISSTSPRRSISRYTSDVASSGSPVRITNSVSPLPNGFGLKVRSTSSTKYGKLIIRFASSQRATRSEEHTSELQSPCNLVCRLLLEKKKQANDSGACRLSTPLWRLLPYSRHVLHP